MMRRVLLLAVLFLLPSPLRAQVDVIADARAAAADGRRGEALVMLEAHLAEAPSDVDARLVYGLVLSWEGRYDDARRQLRQVLAQAPDYMDARVALMNVERWSRQRDASARAWTAAVTSFHDRFSDGRGAWHEQAISLSRSTGIGSIAVRGTRAARVGRTDEQVEVELYPVFRAGTYAFVGVGVAPGATLYPRRRGAFDLYHGLGRGIEVSAGYRRIEFADVAHVYLVTLTKYIGVWMATGKVYHVPRSGPFDATSYHGEVRRYVGADGTSFVGVGYGRGSSREEIRRLDDLEPADTFRGQLDVAVSSRWRLQLHTGVSGYERPSGTMWQTTLGTGLSVKF
jgi:YaiO family outer membrane protein